MGCDNSLWQRAKARIGNRIHWNGQSTVLKKILEPLKYFAVAAIVVALVLLGFQLGKENNRELVQHLQSEKVRLETELANTREENTRLLIDQARETATGPVEETTASDDSNADKPVQLQEPVAAPVDTPAAAAETSTSQEPALGQISETFSTGAAPSSSEQGPAQE
jgi:hypothetical protein